MRKLFSTRYNAGAFNTGLLLLRLGVGILMVYHGYQKFQHFDEFKIQFISFMGLSPSVSLGLTIFSELFCAALIVLGLFTRFASIVLIISCSVALIKAHQWDVLAKAK